jgi:predicted TIM-barrel fold metal-dependent hydrolase
MARFGRAGAAAMVLASAGGLLLLTQFPVDPALAQPNSPRAAALHAGSEPYIDGHTHIDQHDPVNAVALLLGSMDRLDMTKAFIQTEPYGPQNPGAWDVNLTIAEIKKHPDRLGALGGGGTLNPMIIEAQTTGNAGPDVQKKFREKAEELIRQGIVGFGEMSIEHFSLPQSPVKDYEYAAADSPLMLLLADIAAEHNIPVDLHMEALPTDIPTPEGMGPPNPPQLHGNIAAFERLLAHNRNAKIIWAHAGSDNVGFRTPDLMRGMLQRNSNLYLEIKYDPGFPGKDPPIADRKLKPEWLKLYSDFPDRFLIGSDQHFDPPATVPLARAQQNALLLDQMPADLRKKIATENALALYSGRR